MYFAYVDESGNPDPNDKDNKIYVLAAVVMHEKGLNSLNTMSTKKKQQIWHVLKEKKDSDKPPANFEIHMDHINGRRGLYKRLKNDNEKWSKVLKKIYYLVSDLFIKIMTVIIVKEDFYAIYPNGSPSKWAFELLVERINRYVERDSEGEFALLIMDSVDPEADNAKRDQILEFMDRGTGHGWEEYPEKIINFPFIVSSKLHNGVQIADAVVYLIRWYTRKIFGINPKAFFHHYSEELMNLMKCRFLDYSNIGSDTIKFFPTSTDVPESFWNIFQKES